MEKQYGFFDEDGIYHLYGPEYHRYMSIGRGVHPGVTLASVVALILIGIIYCKILF